MIRSLIVMAAVSVFSSLAVAQPAAAPAPNGGGRLFYVSSPGTDGGALVPMRLNMETGAITAAGEPVAVPGVNFAALHPNGKFMYAVGRPTPPSAGSGAVIALAIDPATKGLTVVNQASAGGRGPCHICVTSDGTLAVTANYGDGTVGVVPIGADGKLGEPTETIRHTGSGPDAKRQTSPHPHEVALDPSGKLVMIPDLGTDKVMLYTQDGAKLKPAEPASFSVTPGAGPRHLAWHPNGKFVYVINEMASTISAFSFDAGTKAFKEIQYVPTVPADYTDLKWAAEVVVHPNGKFLFASNRKHDTIVRFAVDEAGGKLSDPQYTGSGKTPRFFCLDPSGKFLLCANQEGDSILVFEVNGRNGELRPTGEEVKVGAPHCITFVPE